MEDPERPRAENINPCQCLSDAKVQTVACQESLNVRTVSELNKDSMQILTPYNSGKRLLSVAQVISSIVFWWWRIQVAIVTGWIRHSSPLFS